MQQTVWKSAREISYSLEPYGRVALFSCGVCANLSGTGGHAGLRFMRGELSRMGKQVVGAKVVVACCAEEIMRQAIDSYGGNCEAVVVLSCAGGVKAAALNSAVPVIAACDTVGSTPVRLAGSAPADLCSGCGACVLSLTGGICPLSRCPLKKGSGPCAKSRGVQCVVDPQIECVWHAIGQRGVDLTAIAELKRIQQQHERYAPLAAKPVPDTLRKLAGWVGLRSAAFSRVVTWIR